MSATLSSSKHGRQVDRTWRRAGVFVCAGGAGRPTGGGGAAKERTGRAAVGPGGALRARRSPCRQAPPKPGSHFVRALLAPALLAHPIFILGPFSPDSHELAIVVYSVPLDKNIYAVTIYEHAHRLISHRLGLGIIPFFGISSTSQNKL